MEEEFTALFAEEAAARLARLERGMLQLEEHGSNAEVVAAVFREAHTLKGAAGVLGFEDVVRVAHAVEDVLERVRDGSRAISPALVTAILATVDGLREVVREAVAGDRPAQRASALVAALRTFAEGEQDGRVAGESAGSTTDAEPAARRAGNDTIHVPAGRVDELVRLVGECASAQLRLGRLLHERTGLEPGTVPEFRDLSRLLNDAQQQAMRVRMIPVATLTESLRRAVRDVAVQTGKRVRWEVAGAETELDRAILQQLADPLVHLVRNAVDHGIESGEERVRSGKPETGLVRLHAMQVGSEIVLNVTDDGRGVDTAAVREHARSQGVDAAGLSAEEVLDLVFRPGLSTAASVSAVSGRGVGLDAVREAVEGVRGRVEMRSVPGAGTEFRVVVPMTLAVLPCLLVHASGMSFALPMHSVVAAQGLRQAKTALAEGRSHIWIGEQAVPVEPLSTPLGLPRGDGDGPVVVVSGAAKRRGFRVDAILGQRDVVVKGLGNVLPRLDLILGATVERDGGILLVLDVGRIVEHAGSATAPAATAPAEPPALVTGSSRAEPVVSQATPTVLVVDDALTVRELQRSILERSGYRVCTASDGLEALDRLTKETVDLVLTDVEMPRMDGFALTQAIRARPRGGNLPVVILTSRASEQDRRRGLEAGADSYITKSAFDEAALLAVVDRLLGAAA